MILYSPISGDVCTTPISWRPRTCFLMTQLGGTIPKQIVTIRKQIDDILRDHDFTLIDAQSETRGRDYLLKIWGLLVCVPVGIAIIEENMTAQTMSNIFYELGLMDSLGKETIVIKTYKSRVPSDLNRTEYITYSNGFKLDFEKFIGSINKAVEYYATVARQVENNPLLAIDYYRRAFLISGASVYCERAAEIFESAGFEGRALNSVETLLAGFATGEIGISYSQKLASATRS